MINQSNAFNVDLNQFSGPLDLLLDLAKSQKVKIEDISITKLADQFLEYISKAEKLNLDIASEYLVMASWLAYLKSKLLLPQTEEDEFKVDEVAEKLKLQLKKLELISDEFYRDPVRLLRLLRFKLLFNFDISKSINLGKFNLAKLTNYYFFKEGEKVGLSKFFIALNKLGVSFNENHQVYLDFSRVTHFSNFREMVFLSAKFKNTLVWDTLKNDGLFSQKKYRILSNYFDANSKEEKREKLELIKNIGEDFYNWAKDDY